MDTSSTGLGLFTTRLSAGVYTLRVVAASLALLGLLAFPVPGAAAKHHHYQLIDLGTLGGPSAYKSVNAPGYQILNNAGDIAFAADTPMPDPNCSFVADCFVAHATRWRKGDITDLGTLPGIANGSASGAINARGWITGQSEDGEIDPVSGLFEIHATLWQDDRITDLGTLGDGHWSLGITLNDAGVVVGFASNLTPDPFSLFPPAGTQTRAFQWREGRLRDLGTLGGDDAQALSINQNGQVAGISYTNSIPNPTTGIPTVHPFLWESGNMRDLGTLGGSYAGPGSCSFGAAACVTAVNPPFEGSLLINNHGQVVGTSNLAGDQAFHPFLWERGTMRDLGTLGGDNGVAIWLTETGEVVGEADVPDSPPGCVGLACVHHAFLWERGVMTDLGSLGTDPCSRALMANSRGQIIGTTIAICGQLETRAFLWENGGPMADLNGLSAASASGVNLFEADNINERGEIVASGLPIGCDDRNSCQHLYLLIPCDESHAGVEGCDYGLLDEAASAQRAPVTNQTHQVPKILRHRLGG